MDSWKSAQVLWTLYGINTDLSEARHSLRSTQHCNRELLIQILQVNPNVVDKAELEQWKVVGRLIVVPAGTRNGLWEDDELAQTPLVKGGSKAVACKPGTWCAKRGCRQAKELMILTNYTRTDVDSVGNVVTTSKVMSRRMLRGSLRGDATTFRELKELSREARVDEIALVEAGHTKQQSVSPAGETKLRVVKCGRDLAQFSQTSRERSGQRHERKLVKNGWGSTQQRCGTKEPKARPDEADTGWAEEEPAPPTSSIRSSPCQRPKVNEAGKRAGKRQNRAGKTHVTTPGSHSNMAANTQVKAGANVRSDRRRTKCGIKCLAKEARKQIISRLAAGPRENIGSKLRIYTSGSADTDARTSLWSAAGSRGPEHGKRDLNKAKPEILETASVGEIELEINFVAVLTPEIRDSAPSQQTPKTVNATRKSSTRIRNTKTRAEKEETDTKFGALSEGPKVTPIVGLHRMVGVPRPNKLPWGTADIGPTGKSCRKAALIRGNKSVLIPTDEGNRHAADERKCCGERPIPSQCATVTVPSKAKDPTPMATKAAVQMNRKPRGEPRTAEMPMKNAMVTAYDTHYGSAQKDRSNGSAHRKARMAKPETVWNGDRGLEAHGWKAHVHLTLPRQQEVTQRQEDARKTKPTEQIPQLTEKTPRWCTDRCRAALRQCRRPPERACGRARDTKEEPEKSQWALIDAGECNLEAVNPFYIRERYTGGKHMQLRLKECTTEGTSAPAGSRVSKAPDRPETPGTMKIPDTAEYSGKPRENYHVRWEGKCLNAAWAPERFAHLKLDRPHALVVVNHESMCELVDITVEDTTNPWSWQGEDKVSPQRMAAAIDCTHKNLAAFPDDEEETSQDPSTSPRSERSGHAQSFVLNILNVAVWALRNTDRIQKITAQATDNPPEIESEEDTVILEFARYRNHILVSTVDALSCDGVVVILSKPGRARMDSTVNTVTWLHTIESRSEQETSLPLDIKPGQSAAEAKAKTSKGDSPSKVTKARPLSTDRGTGPLSTGRMGLTSTTGRDTPGYEARITLTKRPMEGRPRESTLEQPAILFTIVLAKGRAVPSQLGKQEGNETNTEMKEKPATIEEIWTLNPEMCPGPSHPSAVAWYGATMWPQGILSEEEESPPGRKIKGVVRELVSPNWSLVKTQDARRPQNPDRGREGRPDSAWGAWGYTTNSADSSNSPGGGPTYSETKTREAARLNSQRDCHAMEVVDGLGGKDSGRVWDYHQSVHYSY